MVMLENQNIELYLPIHVHNHNLNQTEYLLDEIFFSVGDYYTPFILFNALANLSWNYYKELEIKCT